MEKKNLMIVGCGGIGSRHLQSLCKIDIPVNLFAIDINEQSLNAIKKLVDEIQNSNIQLIFSQEFPNNIDTIDLCIIATSSNIRLDILKKLSKTYSIKNIILEKVLFQSIEQFDEAKNIISENKINCWVNCPRREDDCWKEMKKILSKYSNLKLYYGNSDWNMCCNSIHMIDLALWLFGDKIKHIDNSKLDDKIYDSKRKGFIEMTGILTGTFENGCIFQLESTFGVPRKKAIFEISNDLIKLIVNEYEGKGILYKKENNWTPEEYDFHRLLQSEKTHLIAKKILNNGCCNLPTIDESIELHKPMIQCFLDHLNKISDSKHDFCPIT